MTAILVSGGVSLVSAFLRALLLAWAPVSLIGLPVGNFLLVRSGASDFFDTTSSSVVAGIGIAWWMFAAVKVGRHLFRCLDPPVSGRFYRAHLALRRTSPGGTVDFGHDVFGYARSSCVLADHHRSKRSDAPPSDLAFHRRSRRNRERCLFREFTTQAEFHSFVSLLASSLAILIIVFVSGVLSLLFRLFHPPPTQSSATEQPSMPQSLSASPVGRTREAVRPLDSRDVRVRARASAFKSKFPKIRLLPFLLFLVLPPALAHPDLHEPHPTAWCPPLIALIAVNFIMMYILHQRTQRLVGPLPHAWTKLMVEPTNHLLRLQASDPSIWAPSYVDASSVCYSVCVDICDDVSLDLSYVGRCRALLASISSLRSSCHADGETLDALEKAARSLSSLAPFLDAPPTPSVVLSVAPRDMFVEWFVSSHDPSRLANFLFAGLPHVPEDSDIPQTSWPLGRAHHDDRCRRVLPQTHDGVFRRMLRGYVALDDARCLAGVVRGEAPLIVDTGASVCISPCRADFITYKSSKVKIKDLSSSNKVQGEGMVRWHVRDDTGKLITLELPGYHIPHSEVRLLSPQVLLGLVDGEMNLTRRGAQFDLVQGQKFLAHYCPRSRLPVLTLFHNSDRRDFFATAFVFTNSDVANLGDNEKLLSTENSNLSAGQKEVLLWHQRLSHASVSWIQLLMRDRKWLRDPKNNKSLHQGPFIPCSTERAPVCDISGLKCAACLTAKAHVRTPGVADDACGLTGEVWSDKKKKKFQAKLNGTKRKTLKAGHTQPGDCVSADHYISAVPGRTVSAASASNKKDGIMCGTLFVDHASGKIFNFCQFSTDADETLASKRRLEDEAKREGFPIKSFHSDNGVFSSAAFREDCDKKSQTYTFSGVGAHHQNGVAERNIKTVAQWARASMLHAVIHWPARFSIRFWPLALAYAVWVFNRLPQKNTGLCPNELWSSSRLGHENFRRAHVFGCPVYVLDARLQDGKKIPKWDPRARLGMFLGFSPLHSSTVPLVLNLRTGRISPQYHVIFDDKFETVHSAPLGEKIMSKWEHIFDLGCELFLEKEYDDAGNLKTSHIPPLSSEWNPDELARNTAPGGARRSRSVEPRSKARSSRSRSPPSVRRPKASRVSPPPRVSGGASLRRSRRQYGSHRDGPAKLRRLPTSGETITVDELAINFHEAAEEQAALVANRGGNSPRAFHSHQKLTKGYLADRPLHRDRWNEASCDTSCNALFLRDPFDHNLVHDFDPRVLAARASKYNDDNPSWDMIIGSPFEAEYWNAMELELNTLFNELEAWSYVRRTQSMRVLPSIWAFKCKRRADGVAYKHKARFVARGDCQKEGEDFFETWSPVAKWTTIRAMMILALKLNLVSAQCDITAAFIHAKLAPDENIFVHQPRGFNIGREYVMKLNRSLYGLRQAPRYFFAYLTKRLVRQGLTQSVHDPCLFYSKRIVAIIYVDDVLVYARSDADIEEFVEGMKKQEVLMRREDTVNGYLGVQIEVDGNKTILTQTGLIKRVVESLGLSSTYSTACSTPAECAPLPRNKDGPPAVGTFNYATIIGMLLYLVGHSRPDCAFAVHQCARYTFEPKRVHEVALKRIGRYLKGTMDKGLILTPSNDLTVDCYPDADFAGLWGYEDPQDPHCARSRTGFVITLAGCPIVWKSSLQTEIALSTMEAEYVALSTACKDLFPLCDLVHELGGNLGIKVSDTANMHIKIHEDNVGALILGNLEPRRMTLRTKHYAIKYHWFREEIHNPDRKVTLQKIDTKNQLGDMFTKGLSRIPFEWLRKKLMGW